MTTTKIDTTPLNRAIANLTKCLQRHESRDRYGIAADIKIVSDDAEGTEAGILLQIAKDLVEYPSDTKLRSEQNETMRTLGLVAAAKQLIEDANVEAELGPDEDGES